MNVHLNIYVSANIYLRMFTDTMQSMINYIYIKREELVATIPCKSYFFKDFSHASSGKSSDMDNVSFTEVF